MNDAKNLAALTGQLADQARAAIVLSLMDGSSRPTGELQMTANIAPSSASMHLSKLVNAGIISVIKRGRLKFYRISTAAVAHPIEALTVIAAPGNAVRQVARSSINPFAFARTCYDHLAGRLGVEIVAALLGNNFIQPCGRGYEVTEAGSEWLSELGIDCQALRSERRLFATQCLDFTERKHHLGGALGAAILSRMLELEWLMNSTVPRYARLTVKGRTELGKRLSLEFPGNQDVRYRGLAQAGRRLVRTGLPVA
jgi:DNA-binding transcriptional ArsR family regulator